MDEKEVRLAYYTHNIRKQGYVHVPLLTSRKELETAAEVFLEALHLSPEEKNILQTIHTEWPHPQCHVGYVCREKEKGNLDTKEYWQYHPLIDTQFEKQLKHPVIKKLVESSKKIHSESQRTLEHVISAFEADIPGITTRFFQSGEQPRIYLRFLKYPPQEDGNVSAQPHYDKGAFTLALGESGPGLRLAPGTRGTTPPLVDAEYQQNKGLLFPSLTFPEITSDTYLPIGYHDVVQKGTWREGVARWAIVCFCDFLDQRQIQPEEAHPYMKNQR